MWATSLLEKLLPALADGVATHSILNESMIRSIQVQLYKNIKLNPGEIVRHSNDDLVHTLCELKIDLEHALRTPLDDDLRIAIEQADKQVEILLGSDLPFAQCMPLAEALQQCIAATSQDSNNASRKKSFLKAGVLVATLVPFVAYGVHWTIANQFQPAVLEETSIVYPVDGYQYSDGVFSLEQGALESILNDFGRYYFDELAEFKDNPLPNAYNTLQAESLGVSISDDRTSSDDPREEYFRKAQLSDKNIAAIRLFVRNIRDGHILNRVKISAERVSGNDFPWHKLDVESELTAVFSKNDYDPGLGGLWLGVNGAPVTNVTMSTSLTFNNGEVSRERVDSFELLSHGVMLDDGLLTSVKPVDTSWQLVYLPASELTKLSPIESLREDINNFERQLLDVTVLEAYMADKPFVYFPCGNEDAVVLINSQNAKQTFDLLSASAIHMHGEYQLLDGTGKSFDEQFTLPENYVLRETMQVDDDKLVSCTGSLGFSLGLFEGVPAAAGSGWVGALDSLAVSLMDTKKIAQGEVVANKSVLLDFNNKPDQKQKALDDIYILKDGDYMLLNVFLLDMPGGRYKITVYFDEDQVAETQLDVLWPQSLNFKASDVQYFRSEK
ncbi:hypothetical protein [Aurantivibrio plasticivorans]